ncbi:MAG: choice-of-anchor D domain-containing protein [Ignavibacteria bacterium]|nr:choice-of-anchor D domain-containing protein [Ignavibacteria bacterium]
MKLRRMFSKIAVALAVIAIGTSTMFAQNSFPRMSLIEEYTSATCGPCVAATAPMDAVFGVNKGCLTIKYHTPIPVAGDPWNALYPDGYTRYGYYKSSGFSAPQAYINGITSLNPANNQAGMQTVLNADNAKKSAVALTVTVVGNNISIKVNSNIALNNHTLRVAVISYHTTLTGLATEIGGNWNGESEFSNAFLKFVPGINGTALNIGANSDQTFDMTYSAGSGRLWPAGQQYVVAFLQSNATKEVLNSGTNLQEIGAVPTFAGERYSKINRGANESRELTVTNPNDSPVTVDLVISNAATISASGWNVSVEPSSVTVPAKSSVKANVSIGAPNRSWFADIIVEATPPAGVPFAKANSATTSYLSSGTKIVGYIGFSGGINANADGILNSSYGTDAAFLPWNADVMAAYPPEEFDVTVVLTDFNGRGNLRFAASTLSDLVSKGKKVWFGGCLDLGVSSNPQYDSDPLFLSFRALTQNVLGIKNVASVSRSTVSGNSITLIPYTLTGIAGDPISANFGASLNSYGGNAWTYYTQASDIIQLMAGSTSVPFVYSDNDKAKHNGVRYENLGSGSRVVYTTYGLELIRDDAKRRDHAEKILSWLMAASVKAPVLAVSSQSLTFGTVEVNSTKEMNLTITNSGDADLIISDYTISGINASSYSVTMGAPSSPVTVLPGKTHAMTITFAPKTVKATMNANLTFVSNANTSAQVALSGTSSSATSVETEVVSETGAIGLRLNGANPIVTSSSLTLTGKDHVAVTMVDAAGRTVATLFDGAVNGPQQVAVNAGTLNSGTYSIVASNGSEKAVLTVVVTR